MNLGPGRLLLALFCCTGVACTSKLLAEPVSDSNYDDPDDPSAPAPTAPPIGIPDGGTLLIPVDQPDSGALSVINITDLRFLGSANSFVFASGSCGGDLDVISEGTYVSTPVTIASNGTDCIASADPSPPQGVSYVATVDSTASLIDILDFGNETVASSAPLASTPGLVRLVGNGQAWITEPEAGTIEMFTIAGTLESVAQTGTLSIGSGTVGFAVDSVHQTAYTNSPSGVVSMTTSAPGSVGATWPTGCQTAGGVDVDTLDGWVFAGCNEGEILVLDGTNSGNVLGKLPVASGVAGLAYDSLVRHLYVASTSGETSIVNIAANGAPSLLGTFPTAQGAGVIATDSDRTIYVGNPSGGGVLVHRDLY